MSRPQTAKIFNKRWRLDITRNMSFWHQILSVEGHFLHMSDFGVKKSPLQMSLTVNGTQSHIFVSNPNFAKYEQAVVSLMESSDKMKKLENKYNTYSKKLLSTLHQLSKHTNAKNWAKFIYEYRRFSAGLMITATMGRKGAEYLLEKIKIEGFNNTEAILGKITFPDQPTPLYQSQVDLLRIAVNLKTKQQKEIDKKLHWWLNKYQHIPVNFCDNPWTLADAKKQLKSLIENNPSRKLDNLRDNNRSGIIQSKDTLKAIGNKKIHTLARSVAKATYLNEFRKNVFSKVSLEIRPIFKQISKMFGSNNWRDCFLLTYNEIASILNNETINFKKLRKERKKVAYIPNRKGEATLLKKNETDKLYSHVQSMHHNKSKKAQSIIKGLIGNGGFVKGVVKVILSSKDFKKFKPKDILVAPHTSVDYIPIMEKAAAFVTNEGGITSHASIIAREMDKPCIIATNIATKVFKDGDMVEVDANRGIVRKV